MDGPIKRKKVAAGAEVITSQQVLEKLAKEREEKEKENKKIKKNKPKMKNNKLQQAKRKCSFSDSDSEEAMRVLEDTDDDIDPEIFDAEEEESPQITIGSQVLGYSKIYFQKEF